MEFGETIKHPLLRVAVQVGEATIRDACDACAALPELVIHVELDAFPDGREGVRVTVKGSDARGRFTMLLRNYFDQEALWRVAREAWRRREPFGEGGRGERTPGRGWGECGLN